ncbi:odorant receptor 67c-like isoform X3 [Cotesia glomerata]|uniref:odorant receptor 67c-like isoform X3 n=1 Tax=Cotesia glomerata TaxID=32391 RepID=UPI001D02D6E2|nr:odorant receptor 67c-like isoform X3 [Cotesia glomerata]
MDIFNKPYYKTTKDFTTLIGRWPYMPRMRSLIIITLLWTVLILQAIPQIIAMVMHSNDREVVLEALSAFAVDCLLAAKYLNASYHAELIRNLFDRVQRDWKLLINDEEKRILQYHSEIGKLLVTGYTAFLSASATVFIMEPIVPRLYSFFSKSNASVPLRFALPLEYVIFEKENHYWLMLAISNTFVAIIIFGFISCDLIFITLLQHICGQFAVLGYRIENTPTAEITTKNEKEKFLSYQKIDQDVSYQHLVSCIQMHTRAIEFAELLEECFAMTFGVVVGFNLPMISLTGFQIITQSNTVQQILKGLTFIGSQMLHLFFDCYMSQKLNDSSSKITQNIANLKWYNHSVKSQKLLLLMTIRSQRPCKLTPGTIMELSIENYAIMLKTPGSYFTMLLSMQ